MSARSQLFRYESPLGCIGLELDGNRCTRVLLHAVDAPFCSPDHPTAIWLRAYFSGHLLPKVPLAMPRTPFQTRLRQVLLAIPAGEVRTYGEIAHLLHTTPRAAGQALAANPLPILIPCHRVVAANGPGGFSGGAEWKRKLLAFEGAILPGNPVVAAESRPIH
jgi:methylated-DNA-[protein]-cysteine S-methyltransferase